MIRNKLSELWYDLFIFVFLVSYDYIIDETELLLLILYRSLTWSEVKGTNILDVSLMEENTDSSLSLSNTRTFKETLNTEYTAASNGSF